VTLISPRPTACESTRESLPFTLQDVRNAIPAHCFQPNLGRSLAYFFQDVGLITLFYGLAIQLDHSVFASLGPVWGFLAQLLFWPLFWFVQGTLFWALFVVGHDCGHGSFSRHRWVNHLFGHLSHSPILVPYHGWRISHRTHHANTGNIDTDESWYPVTESRYRAMTWVEKLARFHLILLLYPLYLFKRSPGKQGSHFLPGSPLFRASEKSQVLTSTICCGLMLVLLAGLGWQYGLGALVKFYVMPYLVFVVWLDLVTFLHHTDADIPWYRGRDWYFLKGALSTIDHDYGIINSIHHNIGTHVTHHVFLSIPHYHLLEATEAVKPVLGEFYRKSELPVWQALWQAYRNCRYVSDQGSRVYYQPPRRSSRSRNRG
jgi:acyl-lipid omega-3 desaturase